MNDVNALPQLEEKLGHVFTNKKILLESLVHRSYINEHPTFDTSHNERLEFLGDAVLELVVTEFLFRSFDSDEGKLTNLRAALVNAKILAEISNEIGFESFLFLSKGEQKDAGSKARMYILANAIEAIIGAIYIDAGFTAASDFIHRFVITRIKYIIENELFIDPKSKFQEAAQDIASTTPNYRVLNEHGPDHNKNFVVGVYLGDELVAQGEGSSKQEAQEAAARAGIEAKGWQSRKSANINVPS
ncbi:MAG: ribonuclease III [Candidatus Magasanikbacteria bacterium]|nr:ribonuclease III [Candidatus Magasanikbacteria bacterium]